MNTVKLNLPLWSVDLHFFHRPSNFLWGGPLSRFEHATHQHLISLWGHRWQWWWWSWGVWCWPRSTNKEVLKVNEGGWTTREADGFLKSIFRGHIWTRIGFDSLGWDSDLLPAVDCNWPSSVLTTSSQIEIRFKNWTNVQLAIQNITAGVRAAFEIPQTTANQPSVRHRLRCGHDFKLGLNWPGVRSRYGGAIKERCVILEMLRYLRLPARLLLLPNFDSLSYLRTLLLDKWTWCMLVRKNIHVSRWWLI